MTELAYVNGVFGPIEEARVSIDDRGFQFGDGIYEVVAAYDRRPFLLDKHLQRLHRSAAAIALDLGRIADPLEPVIGEGLRRCGLTDVMIYIQITRGVAPRSHAIPDGLIPTVVMTFRPLPKVPEELRQRGAKAVTTIDRRWSSCFVKAVTLLPNTLAKQEALQRGYDEAIFVTPSGEVRECTVANLLIVRKGKVVIPTRDESILHGVTQGLLLGRAAAIGVDVREQVCGVETLKDADEVFMSGTTVEVLAITSIDDQSVGTGRVGPITRRLYDEFRTSVRAFADGAPAETITS